MIGADIADGIDLPLDVRQRQSSPAHFEGRKFIFSKNDPLRYRLKLDHRFLFLQNLGPSGDLLSQRSLLPLVAVCWVFERVQVSQLPLDHDAVTAAGASPTLP